MNTEQVEAAALLKDATALRDRLCVYVDKCEMGEREAQDRLSKAWELLEQAQIAERNAQMRYRAAMDA